jgi:hypothetical protein
VTGVPVRTLTPASAFPQAPGGAYDRAMTFCAAWFLLGLFADGWSHYHDVRESFFTPYHALLYSGFFSNVAIVAHSLYRGRRAGLGWRRALPPGYDLTAIGVVWFTVGVIPDVAWHRIFGIEEGIDVLISPTHLFLGVGMALILLGPARAALSRRDPPTAWEQQWPMAVSLALFLAMIEFTLQFAFDSGVAASDAPLDPAKVGQAGLAFFLLPFTYYKEALGITIVVIHAALIAGFALYVVRRVVPAFGVFIVLYALPAFLMAVLLSSSALSLYVPTVEGLAAGLVADILASYLRPTAARPLAFRAFAVAVPVATYAIYLGVAQFALGGVWWDVNLTFGSLLFAGVAGFLLSYLTLIPEAARPAP